MNRTRTKKKLKVNLPTNVFTIRDKDDNKIISTHHGTFATIRLKLKDESFHREIGTIIFEKREFQIKRCRTKHLLNKANAYGFNHYLLDNAKMFDFVLLEDEYMVWRIPREYILQHGSFLHFKNNGGFELQIFVGLDLLKQFLIQEKAIHPI